MKELARARWRCRRGLLELDIVLQRFMDKYYTQLDTVELQQFETLLSLADSDLWDIIAEKNTVMDKNLEPVLHLLQKS
ncbi:MAG: succinate dehydrogenase assembly factor 2 [Nitrosomonas sp.]|nr:succinate dehydrogenase assembly factor 2 [Nitrosomonas sp.]MDP1951322.1 succinate dehydrogenase assembly factor 2 [Nitrosomonas sp.]